MPNIGPTELIVILVIALLVLGPKKLPEVGKSLGKGIREFKDGISSSAEARDEAPALPQQPPAQVGAPPQAADTVVASRAAATDER
jgi:sec-independent protein translocase protein TatA